MRVGQGSLFSTNHLCGASASPSGRSEQKAEMGPYGPVLFTRTAPFSEISFHVTPLSGWDMLTEMSSALVSSPSWNSPLKLQSSKMRFRSCCIPMASTYAGTSRSRARS